MTRDKLSRADSADRSPRLHLRNGWNTSSRWNTSRLDLRHKPPGQGIRGRRFGQKKYRPEQRLVGPEIADTLSFVRTVPEIEQAIEGLSYEEVDEQKSWLFDREIETDAKAGRLDSFADKALLRVLAKWSNLCHGS